MVNYKAQVLRGEKWFHLMTAEQLAKEPANSSKPGDVAVYLESVEKVKASKEVKEVEVEEVEVKSKGKK